jgi:hypothetical protein
MGFPLRSNVFVSGTNEQQYFASFPIQAAVLFSPSDQQFSQALREIFLSLDRLTGDDVAFFAVLDPPQDWLEEARDRSWWQNYQQHMGQTGFTYNDPVLVLEIARLFRVSWRSLPCLIAGTDLWAGEYITTPTSTFDIERQLEALTQLARKWGQPNVGHIDQTLSDLIGYEAEYHPPDYTLRNRLNRVYGVLETAPRLHQDFNFEKYWQYLDSELRSVENALNRVRQHGRDTDIPSLNSAFEEAVENATGMLVAPATVAMRVWERLQKSRDIPLVESLDEESAVMVKTALRVGELLEQVAGDEQDIFPRRRSPLRTQNTSPVQEPWTRRRPDFTPGAQGAWKAFEREINLSVIQAARASRQVTMPHFFALYDPSLPEVRGQVRTGSDRNGRPIIKDINQRDWEHPQTRQHRFLSLGDAFYVITKGMMGRSTEDFDRVVQSCLQPNLTPSVNRVSFNQVIQRPSRQSLPSELIEAWKRIYRIRNKSSHTELLTRTDYEQVLDDVLSPDVLRPLMKIKNALSQ